MTTNTFQKPTQVLWDIIASRLPQDYDLGVLSRVVMVNIVIITGELLLILFGVIVYIRGNSLIAAADFLAVVLFAFIFLFLRKTQKIVLVCNISLAIIFLFFMFLFITGGINHTSFLWSFSFPLMTLAIVGRLQGSFWNFGFLLTALISSILSPYIDFITVYNDDLLVRFFSSYCLVFFFSFIFESSFQIVLKREKMSNSNLKVVLEKLQNTTVRKEYVEKVINSLLDSLIVLSKDKCIVSLNKAACALLEYKEDELIGKPISVILANNAFKKNIEDDDIFELFTSGESSLFESSFRTKQGAEIPVLFSGSLILDESGAIEEIACVAVDLRTQKKNEEEKLDLLLQLQQSQKMEAIGTLAGGIAHDFNNIISTIRGFTQLATERCQDDKETSEHLKIIMESSERASSLVTRILTFSRIDDSQQEVEAFVPILRETIKMMRAVMPANIEIIQEIGSVDAMILANATHIHQILVNICTNASHAMAEKGGVLEFRLVEIDGTSEPVPDVLEENELGYIKLSITDSGIGMTPEVKERIFDPFFTTKAINEGTGLGLSTVHGLIKSHRGAITVESTPGEGTKFDIYFPVASRLLDTKPEIKNTEATHGSGHIMVVEDEISLSKFNQIALGKLGYQTTVFNNPLDAVKAFSEKPTAFGLVFTDLSMPNMTGLELSRQIRNIDPTIPIVIASGNQTELQQKEAEAIGVNHFILKPVKFFELSKILSTEIRPDEAEQPQPVISEPPNSLTETEPAEENEKSDFVDDDFLSLIRPQFYSDRFNDIDQIQSALEVENYQLIAEIGHKIAGSSQSLGFTRYNKIARELQRAAQNSIKSKVQDLKDELLNCLIEDHSNLP